MLSLCVWATHGRIHTGMCIYKHTRLNLLPQKKHSPLMLSPKKKHQQAIAVASTIPELAAKCGTVCVSLPNERVGEEVSDMRRDRKEGKVSFMHVHDS